MEAVQWLLTGIQLLIYPRVPFVSHDPVYECYGTNITYDDWIEKTSPRPILGCIFLLVAVFFEIIYIFVFLVFCRTFDRTNASSLLILVNSLYDLGNILAGGIMFGYFMLHGYVYCTNPYLVWFIGAIGLGFWCGSCITSIALAWFRYTNIRNMDNSNLSLRIRLPRSACLWILLSVCMFFLSATFSRPPLFNSELATAVYDPRISDHKYFWHYNLTHLLLNLLTPFIISYIYILFILQVRKMTSCFTGSSSSHDTNALQYSFFVCGFKGASSFAFVIVQFYNAEWLNILTSIFFLFTSFSSCFVLIVFNSALRKNIMNCLPSCSVKKNTTPDDELGPSGMVYEMRTTTSMPTYSSIVST